MSKKYFKDGGNKFLKSNESIFFKVVPTEQKLFINDEELFCKNSLFDIEYSKNEHLKSCESFLIVYNREKINQDDFAKEQIEPLSVGYASTCSSQDGQLWFYVFLDNDTFNNMGSQLTLGTELDSICLVLENHKACPNNRLFYKDNKNRNTDFSTIAWMVKDPAVFNFLTISEVAFEFKLFDNEQNFDSPLNHTSEEIDEVKRHNKKYELESAISNGIHSSGLWKEMVGLKNGLFSEIQPYLLIITISVVLIAIKLGLLTN